jgi:hypothetical protein
LVVSPTHAEGARVTSAIRDSLKAQGKLGEEQTFAVWLPAHLTDAQKADAANYDAGDMIQFHQNAPGHKAGSRQVVTEGEKLPVQFASRFEVYRPGQLGLAIGDRLRITAGGKTKEGKHRLNNGSLFTIQGFTLRGDIVVNHGWVIDRDFGHVALGYAVTSHASQGKTVDKVLIGQSSLSFPASNARQWYVSVSRGREQALVFTDDKEALLKAVERPDQRLSATEFVQTRQRKPALRARLNKHLAFVHRLATFEQINEQHSDRHLATTLQREIGNV